MPVGTGLAHAVVDPRPGVCVRSAATNEDFPSMHFAQGVPAQELTKVTHDAV